MICTPFQSRRLVRRLIELQVFSSVRKEIERSARRVRKSTETILLISPPSLNGVLSSAPIEASLIDARIPYRRRLSEDKGEPFHIRIVDVVGTKAGPESNLMGLEIYPITVEGLRGKAGDPKRGTLSTVAQAHALAQEIPPTSSRIRRMRPWTLSGNWIDQALDTTYDPVFTALRDFLTEEGSIRVVPVTEVDSPETSNYDWIDVGLIQTISEEWESFDLSQKEDAMGSLVEQALSRKMPSTARLEELLWHCVLGTNWKSDLASQVTKASKMWESKESKKAASELIDSLISQGII